MIVNPAASRSRLFLIKLGFIGMPECAVVLDR